MAILQVWTGWPSSKLSPNGRYHFREKAKASRIAKNDGYYSAFVALTKTPDWKPGPGRLPVAIHAFPPSKRNRDDDNLIASCKAILDGIAAALGVDDSRFEVLGITWGDVRANGQVIFEIGAG
jgi:crossover junction endodeoxyribonuclease RusA